MKITERTVLITGGGTGIGRALAEELYRRGNRIIICGRRINLLKDLAACLPGTRFFACDVGDPVSLNKMVKAISKGKIFPSVLINNAAVLNHYQLNSPAEMDIAQMKYDMAANFFGPVELTNLLLPALVEQKDPLIVNVGSPVGIVPLSRNVFYSASKAALHSYTRSLRYSLKEKVRVIEVFPPVVATDMSPKIRKEMPPDKFALKMLSQIEKGKDEIWIGDAKLLKIIYRLTPRKSVDIVNDYEE